jgi:hypothetical protein
MQSMAPPFAAIRISPAKPLRGLQGRAIPASTPILTLLEQRRDSDKAGVSFAHKKEDRLDWGF